MQIGLSEFIDLVEAGYWQVLGYASMQISHVLANADLDPNGEVPWDIRQRLQVINPKCDLSP